MIRLQKILAQAGIASRRKSEQLILDGKVKVDGVVVTELGTRVNSKQIVTYNDQVITLEPKVYFLLYKPKRIISSVTDNRNRKTVIDLIPCEYRIFPVGRLDYDTSGALILTNDGDFANALTHPSFHLEKTYEVSINGLLKPEHIQMLEKGVDLDYETTSLPARIDQVSTNPKLKQSQFSLMIKEGRYHQVKRMMEFLGFEVINLHRSKISFLELKDLGQGAYRPLKPFEIKKLMSIAMQGRGR